MGFNHRVCWTGAHGNNATLTFPLQNFGIYAGDSRAVLRVLGAFRGAWAAATRLATPRLMDVSIEMSLFDELFARDPSSAGDLRLTVDSHAGVFQN
eukprot:5330233-Prymnesium_polylepis.1